MRKNLMTGVVGRPGNGHADSGERALPARQRLGGDDSRDVPQT